MTSVLCAMYFAAVCIGGGVGIGAGKKEPLFHEMQLSLFEP
jgi:hypothetical protein